MCLYKQVTSLLLICMYMSDMHLHAAKNLFNQNDKISCFIFYSCLYCSGYYLSSSDSSCCCSSNPTGPVYYDKLDAVKDVLSINHNSYDFFIFGKHPQYLKKHILIQSYQSLCLHYW